MTLFDSFPGCSILAAPLLLSGTLSRMRRKTEIPVRWPSFAFSSLSCPHSAAQVTSSAPCHKHTSPVARHDDARTQTSALGRGKPVRTTSSARDCYGVLREKEPNANPTHKQWYSTPLAGRTKRYGKFLKVSTNNFPKRKLDFSPERPCYENGSEGSLF